MSTSGYDMICKALDMAQQAVDYYDKSMQACSTSLGMDIFQKLKEDKQEHVKRLQELHKGLASGGEWEQVCTLPEDEVEDAKEVVKTLTAKHEGDSCPASELDAISSAVSMEEQHLKFYQDKLNMAADQREKEFLQRMEQETRQHYAMVTDLHHFYEDPQAWYRNQGGGLDGA